jgi:hypothetical protein
MKLVKLLEFTSKPSRPCVGRFKLPARKLTKSLFSRGGGFRSNGMKRGGKRGEWEGQRSEVKGWEANSRDGTNVSNGQSVQHGIVSAIRLEEVEFLDGSSTLSGSETTLESKDKVKRASTRE